MEELSVFSILQNSLVLLLLPHTSPLLVILFLLSAPILG